MSKKPYERRKITLQNCSLMKRLEEVVFNDTSNNWEITIGFSQPWQKDSLAASLGN